MNNIRWKIAQYAEISWWKIYLKNKPVANYLDWKAIYWNTFLQEAEVYPKIGEQVLDAGCGPAGIFVILDEQRVDAIDPLLNHYDEKLDHFQKSNYPAVSFSCTSLEDFQPVKSYNLIFCLNAINHVRDIDACLDKLVSCTEAGGKMVISVDAHNHKFFRQIFTLLQIDTLHPHQYTLNEYRQKLVDRGLIVLKEPLMKKGFFFDYYTIVCQKPE